MPKKNQSNESRFPTEFVDLPSKGLVYPEGHPLREGRIEIKYMTAKEEDILTSQNLIQKGIVIDELLKSLIKTKVDFNDIVIGDKNAVMLASRILGYGKQYVVDITCPSCAKSEETDFDLTSFEYKEIDEDFFKDSNGVYKFTLPNAEREIEFRFLTQKDESDIDIELSAVEKAGIIVSPEVTSRLRRQIVSVDGNDDQEFIKSFINNEFFALDSRAFREYYSDKIPDVNFDANWKCDSCQWMGPVDLPVTVNFFWPSR
jgi:hypothetical protein